MPGIARRTSYRLDSAWTRKYDGFGRTKEMLDPLGNKSTWEYDAHHQPTTTKSYDGSGGLLAEIKHVYDARSRPTSVAQSLFSPGCPVRYSVRTS